MVWLYITHCTYRSGEGEDHRIYTEYQSVCPFVGFGSPPPPHAQASVAPPLCIQGGDTLACGGRGWGNPIPTKEQTLWCSMYTIILLRGTLLLAQWWLLPASTVAREGRKGRWPSLRCMLCLRVNSTGICLQCMHQICDFLVLTLQL